MPERVAVIAVHGVGHHEPLESAKAAADLLVTANPRAYTPFVESPLRIPVTVVAATGKPSQRPTAMLDMFEERPEFVRNATDPPDPDLEIMREQLSAYVPRTDDRVYETASFRSTRTGADGGESEVHVYDMYWTDLSRVATTGLRMIGELYQLLFYVCGLGRHTLDFATDEYQKSTYWSLLARAHRYAERLLVIWIPIANLCALGLAILVVPQKIYQLNNPVAPLATACALALVFILGGFAYGRRLAPAGWWPWVFWLSLPAAALAGWLMSIWFGPLMHVALAMAFWLLVAAAIVVLMDYYDRRRPGALPVAVFGVVVVTIMLMCPVVTRGVDGLHVSEMGLRAGLWLYYFMHVLWIGFIGLALLVTVMGFLAPRDASGINARTVWTANLSLALPGFLTLVLTLGVWRGCLKVADKLLDPAVAARIKEIIDVSTPWPLFILLVLAVVAFFSVVWGLLPSLIGEVLPRQVRERPAPVFGEALSAGFRTMRVAGEIIRWSMVLGLPVATMLAVSQPDLIPIAVVDKLQFLSQESTFWVGLALIAMVAGPGPLRALALGLRTGIDVAIVVANWLRLHPLEENPRARICARYTSLLRNILDYRSTSDNKGFDRIVIFAHSQGTVISSELLRYLNLTGHPLAGELKKIPVYLFTMGCPLRQLYSQRFPLQYEWGRFQAATVWPGNAPDPGELGIGLWSNAYRSGDYVGRALWFPDDDPLIWGPAWQAMPDREEVCIGAGAHTHYWDDSAPEIASRLDRYVS